MYFTSKLRIFVKERVRLFVIKIVPSVNINKFRHAVRKYIAKNSFVKQKCNYTKFSDKNLKDELKYDKYSMTN